MALVKAGLNFKSWNDSVLIPRGVLCGELLKHAHIEWSWRKMARTIWVQGAPAQSVRITARIWVFISIIAVIFLLGRSQLAAASDCPGELDYCVGSECFCSLEDAEDYLIGLHPENACLEFSGVTDDSGRSEFYYTCEPRPPSVELETRYRGIKSPLNNVCPDIVTDPFGKPYHSSDVGAYCESEAPIMQAALDYIEERTCELLEESETPYFEPGVFVTRRFGPVITALGEGYEHSGLELRNDTTRSCQPAETVRSYSRTYHGWYNGQCSSGTPTWAFGIVRKRYMICDQYFQSRGSILDIVPVEGCPLNRVKFDEICVNDAQGKIRAFPRQVDDCPVGNPCVPSTGNKMLPETDWISGHWKFTRHYNSVREVPANVGMGAHWTHSFGARILNPEADGSSSLVFADERNLLETFEEAADGVYRSVNQLGTVLYRESDGFRLERKAGETLYFDSLGRLVAINDLDDPLADKVLLYQDEQLTHVVDGLGRQMVFSYQDEQLDSVTFPNGTSIALDYTAEGDISTVDRLDSSAGVLSQREFLYEDPGLPGYVTGIIQEDGTRLSTYAYDAFGRVTSSEHAGGVNSVSIEYPTAANDFSPGQRRVVINGVEVREYGFSTGSPGASLRRLESLATNVDPAVPGSGQSISRDYDGDQRVTRKVDAEGNETHYSYDSLSRVDERIEAYGQPEERKIVQAWDASVNRLSSRLLFDASGQQFEQRTYAYNAAGQLTAECLHDYSAPTAAAYACGSSGNAPTGVRQTRYLRCESSDIGLSPHYCPVEGALKAIDGPRVNADDRTEFVYYDSDATGCASGSGCAYLQGDLSQVVNALGHAVHYTEYDPAGRPLRVLDENGAERVLSYHPRGWLASGSVNGIQTSYSYFDDGTLASVTRADGSSLNFEYDQARRLTAVEDGLGGRMEFTLNAAGQREREVIQDDSGTLKFQVDRHFDDYQRLQRLVDGLGFETTFGYDRLGNQTLVTDPLLNSTNSEHDAFSRIDLSVDAMAANTSIDYNVRDQVVAVTDAEGLTTSYSYNALGDLAAFNSPDTGLTTYGYDAAGNRVHKVDARGISSDYHYDTLNRLTLIEFPDPSQNITYHYDEPAASLIACDTSYSVGRMTRMVDTSGTTQWCYDGHGNVTKHHQIETNLDLNYKYDNHGRLGGIDYPSGKSVVYLYDQNGSVLKVLIGEQGKFGQRPKPFVSHVNRAPFGPVERIDFQSGRSIEYVLDANYQIIEASGEGLALAFDRDPVGNILNLISPSTQAVIEEYGYDGVYRLENVSNASSMLVESFTYDMIGNRQSRTSSSGTVQYGYQSGTHRLSSVGSDKRVYDAMGNLTARMDGLEVFTYDDRGRLVQADNLGPRPFNLSFIVNGLGQRVSKHVAGGPITRFVYDEAGRLMGEYKSPVVGLFWKPWREYIWLGDRLVGVIDETGAVNEVYTDHLGTPRAVLSPSGQPRWEWDFEQNAFGDRVADSNPSGGDSFEFNLRFPGQYFDAETGLHYNYFRDYEPQTGRYVQSDPIGLEAGLSTYGYALQSPLAKIDPLGLTTWICGRGFSQSPGTTGYGGISHTYLCATTPDGSPECGGHASSSVWPFDEGRPTTADEDYYHPDSCTEISDDEDDCMEQCFLEWFDEPRPRYSLTGMNCHQWTGGVVWDCVLDCKIRRQ